jgi:hypothetical protein
MAAASKTSTRLSVYGSQLNRAQTKQRVFFSTQPRQERVTVLYIGNNSIRTNPLLAVNERFPFAGEVSTALAYQGHRIDQNKTEQAGISGSTTLTQLFLSTLDLGVRRAMDDAPLRQLGPPNGFDISAVDCPKLLRKDLKELFPGEKFGGRSVSVLNVTQQTENDMAVWAQTAEVERRDLTSKFVNTALTLCTWLKQHGYWADFIDPDSGRPYLSAYTNSTLFETDERYGQLGFEIEDLGCCKVIKHSKWSTRAMVGTIFTDAPLDSQVIQKIVADRNC